MIYKHKFLVGINSVNKKFKMKNKAINRDTFEADVMKIGHIE